MVRTDFRPVLDRFVDALFSVLMDQQSERAHQLELTAPQVQVLRILYPDGLSTGDLALRLRTSAPAVTQLADRLVRKGLVERRAVETDRRRSSLLLTGRGKRLIDELKRQRNDAFAAAMGLLSRSDQELVLAGLEKLTAALRGDTPSAFPSLLSEADSKKPVLAMDASNVKTGAKPASAATRIRMEWD